MCKSGLKLSYDGHILCNLVFLLLIKLLINEFVNFVAFLLVFDKLSTIFIDHMACWYLIKLNFKSRDIHFFNFFLGDSIKVDTIIFIFCDSAHDYIYKFISSPIKKLRQRKDFVEAVFHKRTEVVIRDLSVVLRIALFKVVLNFLIEHNK